MLTFQAASEHPTQAMGEATPDITEAKPTTPETTPEIPATTLETEETTLETTLETTPETPSTTPETTETTLETPETTLENNSRTASNSIVDLLRHHPDASRAELAEYLGLTQDGIKYHLSKLRAAGVIRHVGPTKGGHWEVLE